MADNFPTVMVVCTGNIARSPMGERLLRDALGAETDWSVDSTGVGARATTGMGMYAPMAERLEDFGLSAEGHQAKQLTNELAFGSDLILVLDSSHRAWILDEWPALLDRTILMYEAAELVEEQKPESVAELVAAARHSSAHDIEDPYLRGDAAADAAAERIKQSVEILAPWLNTIG